MLTLDLDVSVNELRLMAAHELAPFLLVSGGGLKLLSLLGIQ